VSATVARPVPTAGEAISIIAGLTLKRLLRGRLVWFVGIAAGLPSLIALAMANKHQEADHVARVTLGTVQFLFAILAPMLVGSSIGDELGSKTATYLWSRPLPRWTILVGKLVVLGPVTAAILAGSWTLSLLLGHGLLSGQAIGAVALGGLAVSIVVAAIATIGPRHGIAFSLLYVLLIDLPIGAIPASIRQLSVIHQTSILAGLPGELGQPATGSPVEAAIWLVAMSAVWLAVALHLLRKREA